MKLYMRTTKDRYELPLAVAESAEELGRMTGHSVNTIQSMISHKIRGWYRVVIEDPKLYPDNDGGLWYREPDTGEIIHVED